jgi:dTDP-4-dehydrorhamnose 3,5-epimerase-like enzyme
MHLDQVHFVEIPTHGDHRGMLTCIEADQRFPIEVKRLFYLHHVSKNRGGHANKITDQVLIPLSGSMRIRLYDSLESKEFLLDDPSQGLLIPHLIYLEMFDFRPETVLLVLANTHYDENEYLRSIEDYLNFVRTITPGQQE